MTLGSYDSAESICYEGALGIWSGKQSTVLGVRISFQNIWFSCGTTG